MCVIIYKPKHISISKKTLKKAFNHNSDGAGFSYFDSNLQKIKISKGFMSFHAFYEAFKTLPIDLEILIHFRLATHGQVLQHFTHPFIVDKKFHAFKEKHTDNLVFYHNGILNEFGHKNFSDSADYAQKILANISDIETIKHVLSKESSKFALHYQDKIYLINDYVKYKNCYFSNLNFLETNFGWHKNYDNLRPYISTKSDYEDLISTYIDEYLSTNNYLNMSFSQYLHNFTNINTSKLDTTLLDHEADSYIYCTDNYNIYEV